MAQGLSDLVASYMPCQETDPERCLLHRAVMVGDLKRIEELLSLGFNPNVQDAQGHTPIMLSVTQYRHQAFDGCSDTGQPCICWTIRTNRFSSLPSDTNTWSGLIACSNKSPFGTS